MRGEKMGDAKFLLQSSIFCMFICVLDCNIIGIAGNIFVLMFAIPFIVKKLQKTIKDYKINFNMSTSQKYLRILTPIYYKIIRTS